MKTTKETLHNIVSGVCSSITRVHFTIVLDRLNDIDDRLHNGKLEIMDLSFQLREAYTYYLEFMEQLNLTQYLKYERS
ncbi:hypothetical protein FIA58_009190 [Flavobacterium jejuense]|uniref:Uncharacterized protein n=1 Tax=Flavobacterium jejuense TaxID=1544455 RepID=A0ABX0IPU7_9FLAO|nr:hypothetical protein [Flavobacterium jejuense]NHN25847.1 hypothetical protein [Flavobacterium jejuense]